MKSIKSLTVLLVLLFSISSVSAKTLTERLADGHKLRLGFGTAVPWAYAGDGGEVGRSEFPKPGVSIAVTSLSNDLASSRRFS